MPNPYHSCPILLALMPLLLSGCLAGDGEPSSQNAPLSGEPVLLTAANVETAAGETTTLMDVVSSVATLDDSLLEMSSSVVPCSLVGYGGEGTIGISGILQHPGDKMDITYNGCTVAGAPINGTLHATLNSRYLGDDGEGYSTTFLYQGFTIGGGHRLVTSLTGSITVEGNYDYLSETMTTTRTSSSLTMQQEGGVNLKVTEMRCLDSYTGLWDTAPFVMQCDLQFQSGSLGGAVSVVTTEPFRGVGGENRPTSGEIRISGANGSTSKIIAREDGETVLITWDENGDGLFEGQVIKTWQALKLDLLNWANLLR